MADFVDAFDRVISSISAAETTTNDVREMLKTLMTGKVGAPSVPVKTEDKAAGLLATIQHSVSQLQAIAQENKAATVQNGNILSQIKTAIEGINPKFAEEISAAKQQVDHGVAVATAPALGGMKDKADYGKGAATLEKAN